MTQLTTEYSILKLIETEPDISQRELARRLGVSVGKTNYCLKALINKGFVKFGNFRRSPNKMAYAYFLTPAGLEEKARLTFAFLRFKEAEYERIRQEIESLRAEAIRPTTNIGNTDSKDDTASRHA